MKKLNWCKILGHKTEIENLKSPCDYACYHRYICKRCGMIIKEWENGIK